MHSAGTSSLNAGPVCQGALELEHGARDLVAHGSMTLMVLDRTAAGEETAPTSGTCSAGMCRANVGIPVRTATTQAVHEGGVIGSSGSGMHFVRFSEE